MYISQNVITEIFMIDTKESDNILSSLKIFADPIDRIDYRYGLTFSLFMMFAEK